VSGERAAAHAAIGAHGATVSAGISAAVITTAETAAVIAAIGAAVEASTTTVEAAATADVATTTATVATMLGNPELRNEYECCRRNAGEKYLQNGAIPHIVTLRQSMLALIW
jgi:hypothetical protein